MASRHRVSQPVTDRGSHDPPVAMQTLIPQQRSEPTVVHHWIPDCGCDACDSGSQDALDELDEYLAGVVTGQFRRLQGGEQTITVFSHSIRQSSGGRRSPPDADRVLANPKGWNELTGPSWL